MALKTHTHNFIHRNLVEKNEKMRKSRLTQSQ